jgi:plasmid stabilization system protein ParE
MTYRVELRERARRDLDELVAFLLADSSSRAERWLDGMERAIVSLAEMPERRAIVVPLSRPGVSVRCLLYGHYPHVYKIYFVVVGETVQVLHIRHGARRPPRPRDLRV